MRTNAIPSGSLMYYYDVPRNTPKPQTLNLVLSSKALAVSHTSAKGRQLHAIEGLGRLGVECRGLNSYQYHNGAPRYHYSIMGPKTLFWFQVLRTSGLGFETKACRL